MCHGPSLGGVEMAPPLTGSEFYSNWGDLLVSDLFQRINQTMPQATPGSSEPPSGRRHRGLHSQLQQSSRRSGRAAS